MGTQKRKVRKTERMRRGDGGNVTSLDDTADPAQMHMHPSCMHPHGSPAARH